MSAPYDRHNQVSPFPPVTARVLTVWEGAACSPETADDFFPPAGSQAPAAVAVCARCPVRAACTEEFGDLVYGVVAGETESVRQERRAFRRGAVA